MPNERSAHKTNPKQHAMPHALECLKKSLMPEGLMPNEINLQWPHAWIPLRLSAQWMSASCIQLTRYPLVYAGLMPLPSNSLFLPAWVSIQRRRRLPLLMTSTRLFSLSWSFLKHLLHFGQSNVDPFGSWEKLEPWSPHRLTGCKWLASSWLRRWSILLLLFCMRSPSTALLSALSKRLRCFSKNSSSSLLEPPVSEAGSAEEALSTISSPSCPKDGSACPVSSLASSHVFSLKGLLGSNSVPGSWTSSGASDGLGTIELMPSPCSLTLVSLAFSNLTSISGPAIHPERVPSGSNFPCWMFSKRPARSLKGFANMSRE